MKMILPFLISSAVLFAQSKSKDLCVPPPGGTAPSLPAKILSGQGRVRFPITTSNPKAQEFFEQGVAQMHSFWGTEAERSFLQAAALDPQAPMPHWGIAMVAAGDFRPRHQLQWNEAKKNGFKKNDTKKKDKEPLQGGAARAATAAMTAVALSAVPGKATELEKLYIAAIAARRDAGLQDPDEGYIRGLRNILARYPDEIEAKAYLALHLMSGFILPDRQPRPGSMEAAALLRELLVKAPDHPGVHHFVIHGFEGSSFAKDAWESCRRYPELTPNIPHALHMPGHIWAQTGKWQEAAHSFEAAAESERGYMKADQLYGNGHHAHNVHFLAAANTFQGRYAPALEAARELLQFKETPREAAELDNPYTAHREGWFALMGTLVHFEKWDEILDGSTLPEYQKPREQAWRHWARGLAYAAKGNVGAAKAEAKGMHSALAEFTSKIKEEIPAPLEIARKELEGQIAYASGKTDKALEILEAAGRMERALRYNEPPSYPRPVFEALGRKALDSARLPIAERAFREALDQYPASSRAVSGLAETLRREGKATEAGLARGVQAGS